MHPLTDWHHTRHFHTGMHYITLPGNAGSASRMHKHFTAVAG